MDLQYAVQVLISLLIISLCLLVLMSAMICSSLYHTRPLWIRLREENETELEPTQQNWETNLMFGLCPNSSECQTRMTNVHINGPKTRTKCGSPTDLTHFPTERNWRHILPKCLKNRYNPVWIEWYLLNWKLLRSEIAWVLVRKN